jgi:hypothetical protein
MRTLSISARYNARREREKNTPRPAPKKKSA